MLQAAVPTPAQLCLLKTQEVKDTVDGQRILEKKGSAVVS